MLQLIRPADYRPMRWKNGGGETAEIAAHPPGSGLDAFAWRVSIASVHRDGLFSRFPGVERTIVLLEGAGMRLTGGGRDVTLRIPFEPYTFDGGDTTACTLCDGGIRDFNLMCRRGVASGNLVVVRAEGARIAPAAFRLAYAVTGAHACDIPGHPTLTFDTDETVLIEQSSGAGDAPVAIRPLHADAIAFGVRVVCP